MTQINTSTPGRPKVLFSVQIARGIAVTVVVLAHANLMIDRTLFHGWLITGWCGVDFFFILSGFIIFYANHNDIDRPEKTPVYLYRRFVRIYPVYWVYTAIALLVNLAIARKFNHVPLINWIQLSIANVVRCALLYPTNVAVNQMPIIPVAWTLSYEVLFYAMFGLLVWLRARMAYPLFGAWMCGCLAHMIIPNIFHNLLLNLAFAPRNVEFFFGAAVAFFTVKSPRPWRPVYLWLVFLAGVFLLAATWGIAHYDRARIEANTTPNFGIAFALIVFAMVGIERHRPLGKLCTGVWFCDYSAGVDVELSR